MIHFVRIRIIRLISKRKLR